MLSIFAQIYILNLNDFNPKKYEILLKALGINQFFTGLEISNFTFDKLELLECLNHVLLQKNQVKILRFENVDFKLKNEKHRQLFVQILNNARDYKQLSELKLTGTKLEDKDVIIAISEFLAASQHLKILNLENTGLTLKNATQICSNLPTSIQSLNLSENKEVDHSCFNLFFSKNSEIEVLNLSNTKTCLLELYHEMSRQMINIQMKKLILNFCLIKKPKGLLHTEKELKLEEMALISNLFSGPDLNEISLIGLKIKPLTLKHILIGISKRVKSDTAQPCHLNLKNLTFLSSNPDDFAVKIFQEFQNIEHLNLSELYSIKETNPLSEDCFTNLIEGLKWYSSDLKILNLSENVTTSIKNNRLLKILRDLIIENSTNLTTLNLSGIKLKNHSSYIIDSLDSHKSLENLDISNISLNQDGFYRLVASLRANRNLKILNIDGNNISGNHYFKLSRYLQENYTLCEIVTPVHDIKKMPDVKNFHAYWKDIESILRRNRDMEVPINNLNLICSLELQNSGSEVEKIQMLINYRKVLN